MLSVFYKSADRRFTLLQGDCVDLLRRFDFKFDMIFADPPYFLSNDGISIQNGQPVSVNKGEWDRSHGKEFVDDFNHQWLLEAHNKLKDSGTIWISGTFHNIFSIAQVLVELDFKILNAVTWVKPNPPPNLACRCFTHSSEILIWAWKNRKTPHYFNYELMKSLNDGKQMRDVWHLPAIAPWEKSCGKHPTQKPLLLLARIIQSSTRPNDWILDPFAGSGTTGIAAALLGRRSLGIDSEPTYLKMAKQRYEEIGNPIIYDDYKTKINGYAEDAPLKELALCEPPQAHYNNDNLPF